MMRVCRLDQCRQGRDPCPDPEQCCEYYEGTPSDRLLGVLLCVASAAVVVSFVVYLAGWL